MQTYKIPEYNTATIYPNDKCLSSSQFLNYEESPSQFYIEWVLGARRATSPAMLFGSTFAYLYSIYDPKLPLQPNSTIVEGITGKSTSRIIEALRKMTYLKGRQPEYPLMCDYRGWKFRASLDDFVEEAEVIVENKTGQVLWDQERADNSDQITFQAWTYWKKYGKLPKYIIVNWWNTKEKNYIDLRSFKTKRTLSELRRFQTRVEVVIDNLDIGNFTTNLY